MKRLTEAHGPSGREDSTRKLIIDLIKDHVEGYEIDKVGNLIAWKGKGDPIVLDAHMDEIGIVVTNEIKEGFYRIEPVGGLSPYVALSRRFVFENGVIGVVGLEGETIDERKKNVSNLTFDNLYLDTFGEKLEIGSFGVYESSYVERGKLASSKAMDDRVGCAILVEVAKRLERPKRKVYFAFSIQEEIGLVGASVLAYPLDVIEAIAVDVTDSGDTPKALKRHSMVLGKGPALKVKDRASISDRKILEKLKKIAQENSIPYQMEVLTIGGTDAAALMRTKSGIPSATVSIPTRYIHTPVETIHLDDFENTVRLLVSYLGG